MEYQKNKTKQKTQSKRSQKRKQSKDQMGQIANSLLVNLQTILSGWIKRQHPTICCLHETCFKHKDTDRLKVKQCKNTHHANTVHEQSAGAILISDNRGFGTGTATGDREGHFLMTEGEFTQRTYSKPSRTEQFQNTRSKH